MAHCIQNKHKSRPKSPADVIVKLGKYDLSVRNERGSVIKYADDIIMHPKWNSKTTNYDADIAVIVLDTKVEFTARIWPICLWKEDESLEAIRGTVAGWGKSEYGSAHEDKPREIDLFLWKNAACFLNSSRFALISSANTFCAAKPGGHGGACFGDSGSGLFVADVSKRWFLKGLASSGFVTSEGKCDVSEFSLFTDVAKYTEWIYQTAHENNILLPTQPTNVGPQSSGKDIFCFFEGWAGSRAGNGAFTVNDLKPELCTHLVFLHAVTEDESLMSINNDDRGMYQAFNDLKKKHKHLKTLLSVGSWNEGSVKYSQLAADSERRKRFALNSAAFIKRNGFDGLHFHWEYPANRGGAREDKVNFPLLLRDIKTVFERQNLYLTAMVRVWYDVVVSAYDLRSIAKHVDRILMLTFDMAGYWDNKIGFSAPLKGVDEKNVESSVEFFASEGVQPSKMVIGLPFYGRTFVSRNEGNIGNPSESTSFGGPYYLETGFLGYNEICRLKKEQRLETRFDDTASQAVSKFVKDGKTQVVTYDTPRSVANKMKFVVDKNLAGAWIWFVSSDDLHGDCETDTTTFADYPSGTATDQKTRPRDFPLLRTVNEALEILMSEKVGQKNTNSKPQIEDRLVFSED